MFGRLKDLTINRDGSQNLTVTITSDIRELFDKLKDVEIVIDIKKANKRRSYEANNYLWHLCGEIAKASSKFSNDGKEDVYKEAIRKKGEFEPLLVKEEAVSTFVYRWEEKGLGWFVDIMDEYIGPDSEYADFMGDAVMERYRLLHAYYGSSTYDTLSMSRVIDYVVNMANDLGIPTLTPKEEAKMLAAWGKKVEKRDKVDHAGA